MRKYQNILFDLDGTLTDSSEGIIRSVRFAYEELGYPLPEEKYLPTFIGPPLRENFVKYGIPDADKENAVTAYRKRYNTIGKFENKPYPGMAELLAKLKGEGYHLYVATSKPEALSKEILEHFQMAEYFEEIAGATEDGSRDSKEDVIRYLLDKMSVSEGNKDGCLMVGDTSYDVLGAAKLNIPCICVGWGFGDKEQMLKDGAISIVESMDELYYAVTREL